MTVAKQRLITIQFFQPQDNWEIDKLHNNSFFQKLRKNSFFFSIQIEARFESHSICLGISEAHQNHEPQRGFSGFKKSGGAYDVIRTQGFCRSAQVYN